MRYEIKGEEKEKIVEVSLSLTTVKDGVFLKINGTPVLAINADGKLVRFTLDEWTIEEGICPDKEGRIEIDYEVEEEAAHND